MNVADKSITHRARRNRIKLLLILLLPLLVVGLATLVYVTRIGIPLGTKNKGVLLKPPCQIDWLALSDAGRAPWHHADAAPGWTLLNVGPGDCAQDCRERIYLSRQVRIAMARNAERIHRYYLALDNAIDPGFAAYLASEHEDLRVLHVAPADWRRLLGRAGDPDTARGETLFIVDPRGFLMMYYLPRHTGMDTIRDLEFLLKYSH